MNAHQDALIDRYNQVVGRLNRYCKEYKRNHQQVKLIAVSKRHSIDDIMTLIMHGQIDFAENYLQEATTKIEQIGQALSTKNNQPIWHFIGHIQSKKCKLIAQIFDWVHTIENEKVASLLNQHRQGLPPLNVHIQLNLQNELNKSGVSIAQLQPLAQHISTLPNLNLRGLMIIPAIEHDFEKQRAVFIQSRDALDTLNKDNLNLDQLSMGMTDDMEAAISTGATQVRIGTAIFGQRPD